MPHCRNGDECVYIEDSIFTKQNLNRNQEILHTLISS